MFARFDLQLKEAESFFSDFYNSGIKLFKKQKSEVAEYLDLFVDEDGYLDASRLGQAWFPSIDADVFISHSHLDERIAVSLSGWLYDVFGIKSFIDSCVWGYANDLLKLIDNQYCSNSRNSYDYNKRNQSTAHIHMILNTSLHKMIDDTECLIFLNTPNSILIEDVINGSATASPWIFSELVFSNMCQIKPLSEYRTISHSAISGSTHFKMKYDVCLSGFTLLELKDLIDVWNNCDKNCPSDALDYLYINKGLI